MSAFPRCLLSLLDYEALLSNEPLSFFSLRNTAWDNFLVHWAAKLLTLNPNWKTNRLLSVSANRGLKANSEGWELQGVNGVCEQMHVKWLIWERRQFKTHSAAVPCCCLRSGTVTNPGNHEALKQKGYCMCDYTLSKLSEAPGMEDYTQIKCQACKIALWGQILWSTPLQQHAGQEAA